MGMAWMLSPWRRRVQTWLGALNAHQSKALAWLSLAIAWSQDVRLTRAASALAGPVAAASHRRRFERLLANDRLPWARAQAGLAQRVLQCWAGRRPEILLDETPLHNTLRCMKLSVGYGGRAVPLLWRCYRPNDPPGGQDGVVMQLLQQLATLMPSEAQPVLMCDRGLSWPRVVDFCHSHRWHYVMRVQGHTRLNLKDGAVCACRELIQRNGPCWRGRAWVFQKAGWRYVNVVARWPKNNDEPWLLITDLAATKNRCGQYARRMWQEQSFRDEKSHGFNWQRSRVHRPQHAERLLLAVALAMLWLLSLGERTIKQGQRRRVGRPTRRRHYSRFTLGLRRLQQAFNQGVCPPTTLALYPPI